MTSYRVDLDAYNGPLDLLLYLIREHEVDIYDIPIARITKQYVRFIEILKVIDPNAAGDFLVMLATLMEIKSRAMLPRHLAVETEEDFEDPRMELVRQLLAYKTFKDAAHELGAAAKDQALKFPRQPAVPVAEPGELDLEDVSVWALMNAFADLLEQTGKAKTAREVVFDDTPMALHAADILDSLQHLGGSQNFEAVFAGRTKSEMIGLFLAMLELIRQRRIRITQAEPFGAITIHLIDATPLEELNQDPLDAAGPVDVQPHLETTQDRPDDGPPTSSDAPTVANENQNG